MLAWLMFLQRRPLQWPTCRARLMYHASARSFPVLVCPPRLTQVPTPISHRSADHLQQLTDLELWRQSTLDHIKQLGDTFEQSDGGPSEADLKLEVDWVLDDAVESFRSSPSGVWRSGGWQHLEAELRNAQLRPTSATLEQWQVLMRVPVLQLVEWWKQRLEERMPFQYLVNTAHWRHYILSVGPGVLIPRPETEIFADLAAGAVASNPSLAHAPWADLGTGSGAIAICVADVLRRHAKDAKVWAVDLSPTALQYTQYNAELAGVSGHVTTALGSWCDPLQPQLSGRLGGLVSNPPYIPAEQMLGLQAEVGRHEPLAALEGGAGPGLDSLQVICHQAVGMLMPGGFLALETAGAEQVHLVAELLRQLPGVAASRQGTEEGPAFVDVCVLQDCYGKQRFVTAYRTNVGLLLG